MDLSRTGGTLAPCPTAHPQRADAAAIRPSQQALMTHCHALEEHFLVTDCAWCGRQIRVKYCREIVGPDHSHGICPDCYARLLNS